MRVFGNFNVVTAGLAGGLLLLASLARADVMDDIDECDGCHGKDGVSMEGDVPTIAGISAFAIEEYMYEFRD